MADNTTLINTEILLQANALNFEGIALAVFHHQYRYNLIYYQYCDLVGINPSKVKRLTQIPFLPVSFFKTHVVKTGRILVTGQNRGDEPIIIGQTHSLAASMMPETGLIFESSGTTGEQTSRHYVQDASVYEKSLLRGFEQFYGPPQQYAILALLPSYLERKNASLVHMANVLMAKSGHPDNGFYINEWDKLCGVLMRMEAAGQKVLLLGVTFALLDFAEAYPMKLQRTIVMETGGMKGRKQELTRSEVHTFLKKQWQLRQVHSEYGMTELLSQAYAWADGAFKCTNTMRVLVRDLNDPLDVNTSGTGGLNIADLANVYSCSFVATEDIGRIAENGSFEVLGRMDHSALRGCSLMAL